MAAWSVNRWILRKRKKFFMTIARTDGNPDRSIIMPMLSVHGFAILPVSVKLGKQPQYRRLRNEQIKIIHKYLPKCYFCHHDPARVDSSVFDSWSKNSSWNITNPCQQPKAFIDILWWQLSSPAFHSPVIKSSWDSHSSPSIPHVSHPSVSWSHHLLTFQESSLHPFSTSVKTAESFNSLSRFRLLFETLTNARL